MMTHILCRLSVKHGQTGGTGSQTVSPTNSNPAVKTAMTEAMNSKINARFGSYADSWKPEGVLIAHYAEHRRCVNQIAVSPSITNPFFVTASNDGTVKVWDLKKTDEDLNFNSCATYAAQRGEILSVTPCADHHNIASASSHGSIHIWNVNYAPDLTNDASSDRFTGISSRQEVSPEEGAILYVQQWDALLLYTSQRGVVHAWDIRMKNDAWTIQMDPKEGLIRHIATDPLNGGTWIVTGSSQGFLDVWDVRFKLKVAQWRHPSRNAIVDIASIRGSLEQIRLMGIKSNGPFVYAAAGGNEVALWDIQDQSCKQVNEIFQPREMVFEGFSFDFDGGNGSEENGITSSFDEA